MPPQGEDAPAPAKLQQRRPALSADETEFVRSLVIHQDKAAIVVNKPPGLATQGGTKTKDHLDRLLDGLADEGGPRPKLVHRLDKDTSGALLVARTPRAAAAFAKSFSGRTARKVYWAIVVGVPSIDDGMIELPLAKQPGTGGEKMHVDEEEGLPARTRYRVIERAGNRAAWVELQPLTGRTHQLRVHMLAIGHPILGDGKYGGQDAFLTGAISRKLHLHARRLRIDHPDGGRIDVSAELPEHFAATVKSLGFDPALADRCRSTRSNIPRPPRAGARPPPPPPRRGARSARASAAAGGAADASQSRLRLGGSRGDAGAGPRSRASARSSSTARSWSHAPVVVAAPDRIRFHVARSNRAVPALDGSRALLSCLGPDAYISPDWYGTAGSGADLELSRRRGRRAAAAARRGRADRAARRLSADHEARLAPKPAWTRGKMTPGRFEAMLKAIVGFELTVEALRGTRKLGQHKQEAERAGAAAGLAPINPKLAALMRPAQETPS